MGMNNFTFNTTSGIRFGSGMSKTCVKEISKKLGPNVLFITDKGLMSLNLTEPTLSELSKCSSIVEVFQDVEADPSIKTLLNSIEVGKKINATGVIGFGGGSSMDVAKLASLILGSNEDIEEAWGVSNAKGPRLPLVLIPTTAGTGSEVTPISIITVGEEEKKRSFFVSNFTRYSNFRSRFDNWFTRTHNCCNRNRRYGSCYRGLYLSKQK
jgi:alcohol dehydrogenase class IV